MGLPNMTDNEMTDNALERLISAALSGHALWLAGDPEGTRANLRGADRHAILHKANLGTFWGTVTVAMDRVLLVEVASLLAIYTLIGLIIVALLVW